MPSKFLKSFHVRLNVSWLNKILHLFDMQYKTRKEPGSLSEATF
jgi:hypothetical protein